LLYSFFFSPVNFKISSTFIYLLFGLNIGVAEAARSKGGDGVNEPNVEGVEVLVF